MEHQSTQDNGVIESEEFSNEFMCCVCLDIMYKPVVLACGHISCFWCVFKAMDYEMESHCPVCRNPYNHFPRICGLLHFLLLRLYPSAYKRRQRQVSEEEKNYVHASPQVEDNVCEAQSSNVLDFPGTSSPLSRAVPAKSYSTCRDNSITKYSPEMTSPCEDSRAALPTTSVPQTTNEVNYPFGQIDTDGTCNKVPVTDLQCPLCKELLFRPVVLNCGHVYCEACVNNRIENVCECPVCQSPHPNGFPNVCLVLEHFLEEHFPEEYSARKESSINLRNPSLPGGSTQKQDNVARHSSVPTNDHSSWSSGRGFNVHPAVGCDNCGMYPIIGLRYKCKDCVEQVGFDLCERCHKVSSALPGRFNQQHTKEHEFLVIPPPHLRDAILSLGFESSEEIFVTVVNPYNLEEIPTLPDASENDLGVAASISSPHDDPQHRDGATSSLNNDIRDLDGDSAV